jgi:hypothetical protein
MSGPLERPYETPQEIIMSKHTTDVKRRTALTDRPVAIGAAWLAGGAFWSAAGISRLGQTPPAIEPVTAHHGRL